MTKGPEPTSAGWSQNRSRRRIIRYLVLASILAWSVISLSKRDSATTSSKAHLNSDIFDKAGISSYMLNTSSPHDTTKAVWRKPVVYQSDLNLVVDPVPTPRCRVNTYYDPEWDDEDGVHEIIKTWKRAWWAQGFEPRVLTPKDCKSHPKFNKFMNSTKLNEGFKNRTKKWFAWAGTDAGIFMNYRVIPLINKEEEDSEIMNIFRSCQFDHPTQYMPMGIEFVHASVAKAQKITNALLKGPRKMSNPQKDPDLVTEKDRKKEDMGQTLENLFDYQDQDGLAYYSRANVRTLFDGQEKSGREVAEIMNVHLHHSFLKSYIKKGLAIVDPFGGSFVAEAEELAHRLQQCPESKLVTAAGHSCPPTARVLAVVKELSGDNVKLLKVGNELCDNPCVNKGMPVPKKKKSAISRLPRLPGPNLGFFTIATVPHPMSVLAMHKNSAKVGEEEAKQNPSDTLLSKLIPVSDASEEEKLMVVKDHIFEHSVMTNSAWLLWEKESKEDLSQDEMIEWDLGFRLAKPKTGYVVDVKKPVLEVRDRVLKRTGSDKTLEAIEALNSADTEVWKFLRSWVVQCEDRLNDLIFDTQSLV